MLSQCIYSQGLLQILLKRGAIKCIAASFQGGQVQIQEGGNSTFISGSGCSMTLNKPLKYKTLYHSIDYMGP